MVIQRAPEAQHDPVARRRFPRQRAIGGKFGREIDDISNLRVLLIGHRLSFSERWLAGSLLGSLVSRLVRAGGLGAADRVLGAVFGAARGGIAAVVLVTLAALTPLAQGAAWQGSRLVTYCTVLSGMAMDGWGGASGAVAGAGAPGAGKFVDGG